MIGGNSGIHAAASWLRDNFENSRICRKLPDERSCHALRAQRANDLLSAARI